MGGVGGVGGVSGVDVEVIEGREYGRGDRGMGREGG